MGIKLIHSLLSVSNERQNAIYSHFSAGKFLSLDSCQSVAVAWSVESLPSNPAAGVQIPAGSGILIYVLGLGVCSLFVFCPVLPLRSP